MVRRPNEVFLPEGQQPPEDDAETEDDLSQEELLKQPVYIPHRPKKDPRELKILDPACGSGHFLLYCFDLLLVIYEEAYDDPDLGPALQEDYPTLEDLRRAVPRLILAPQPARHRHRPAGHADRRPGPLAALPAGLPGDGAEEGPAQDHPVEHRLRRADAGREGHAQGVRGQLEPRLLGQLVEVVFDKMKLAGEAGSLLKIEEEIRDAVAEARRQWVAGPVSIQQMRLFDDHKPWSGSSDSTSPGSPTPSSSSRPRPRSSRPFAAMRSKPRTVSGSSGGFSPRTPCGVSPSWTFATSGSMWC